jgi:hypothetical protein
VQSLNSERQGSSPNIPLKIKTMALKEKFKQWFIKADKFSMGKITIATIFTNSFNKGNFM